MKNFFKSNWLIIVVGLVCASVAAGATFFVANTAVQENKASALKMAEELKTAGALLVNANTEMAATKEALEKEKALNADLKKMMAAVDVELESLRSSVNAMTLAAAKTTKPKEAKPKEAKPQTKPVRAVAASAGQRERHSKPGKDKLTVLQNLQADMNKRDSELREKQKKLDEALNKLAAEKRKVILQNAEYRWPHDPVSENK